MKRWWVGLIVLIGIGGLLICVCPRFAGGLSGRSLWGFFISKSGSMAIVEKAMIAAEELALEEINAEEGCWADRSNG